MITHLLSKIPCEEPAREKVELPKRQKPHGWRDPKYPFKYVAERF